MSRCARKNSSVNTLERYTFSNGDTHKDTGTHAFMSQEYIIKMMKNSQS